MQEQVNAQRVKLGEEGNKVLETAPEPIDRPGRAKVLYEKVYCARGRMENSHQGHEALHTLRPHLLPPLGGQFRSIAAATGGQEKAPQSALGGDRIAHELALYGGGHCAPEINLGADPLVGR